MRNEQGLVNPLAVTTVVLGLFAVGFCGFSIWAFMNYQDQKNNTDAKIATAVSDAKREQISIDQKDFAEREKQPTRQLIGPEDLGRVGVSYPKTWSVYLDKDGSGGQYEAYFYPSAVPPLSSQTPMALRLSVVSRSYETVVASYQDKVKSGALKASTVAAQGENGVRLDGTFSPKVQGTMVIFKVRDKTVMLYTESKTFLSDFDNIALKSLTFNK